MRNPDVSETDIVFSYAEDLWIVPKNGGVARHLTSFTGEETCPKFSDDGSQIAYTANYDNNVDVYVMPIHGGIPKRITHHPDADYMIEWFPDNSLLYKSRMESPNNRINQFYKVSSSGGFPEKLNLRIGEEASISPDGKYLAINMMPIVYGGAWKRYMGGAASDIWLFNLKTNESENISQYKGGDKHPMWGKHNIYFLSDRDSNRRANVWVYSIATKRNRQLTFFTEHDVNSPSIGPSDIVFENGGKLYLLNLNTEGIIEVPVRIEFNDLYRKPHRVEVANLIRKFNLTPTGKRVVFEARGELFSVAANEGAIINLTNSPGVAERYPAWSPNGNQLAYFTDKAGEYQLAVRDNNGTERIVTTFKDGFRFQPFWSPDSRKIVFADNRMSINLFDLDNGRLVVIDRDPWMVFHDLNTFKVSWSHDSKWVCWSKGLENRNHAIFIYSLDSGKSYQVTSGFCDDLDPVFDPEGKYLFYLSKRTFNSYDSDIEPTWIYANTTNIVVIPLSSNTLSPLASSNDDEKIEELKDASGIAPLKIDNDGFEERAVILPLTSGNYSNLTARKGKLVYMRHPETGSLKNEAQLCYYNLDERKEVHVITGVNSYQTSFDGEKIIIHNSKGQYGVIALSPNQILEKPINTEAFEVMIDPKEEWIQMYNEAWRYMRDFFYDKGLHGVNWEELGERYKQLLPMIGNRTDFYHILTQLYGEVGAGHIAVRADNKQNANHGKIGLLGMDFSLENNTYRIKKIFNTGYKQANVKSPLTDPGLNVKEGDYILAVNGQPLQTDKDPWAAFEGLANKVVVLRINSIPDLKGSREIVVKTLSDESRLRELDWVRENRDKVYKASNGKIGYIYVTNTSTIGQQELVQQFKAQFHMQGLIIDERFNAGGALGDRFVELLNRKLYGYLAVRNGQHFHMPEVAHPGPMVLITNGWAVSGGDGFPYFFKKAIVGPVIGQATMGALVGPHQFLPLIDGGAVSAPPSRIYNLKGEWDGAQTGVIPDIEVINDPGSMSRNIDHQLDKAIEIVLDELSKRLPRKPKPEPLNHKWW